MDELVERAQAAIMKAWFPQEDYDPEAHTRYSYLAHSAALAMLKSFGLHEELSALYVNDQGKIVGRDQARRHRYVTDWETK